MRDEIVPKGVQNSLYKVFLDNTDMFKYINPVYTDFNYYRAQSRREVSQILASLAQELDIDVPKIEKVSQTTLDYSNKPKKGESRLSVSWSLNQLTEEMYARLAEHFPSAVLDQTG